ncbi:guanine deaminase [Colletotrichum higginsianum]|uniref:Guanine deaminase n=2 Tax=Colletotrichum higginsianum TaxID=80884 RepID=H1W235_COLHI|nr:Guanine deaminase [Colletotrichum higginsianum IMI 349063]OBR16524.1 Guanine deaminase [Colletotrichum higginsianum IMI 349063]TID05006.1 Guanine deaminase [Colletotrichum higginsianum]GJC91246.1 guanine deaminase [Colletotrichum higginsianum]CCF46548.1 guanine deaminase [Colletotrichum higginsianum]
MAAFQGALIHSLGPNQVEILENAGLVIGEDGLISELHRDISAEELSKKLPNNVRLQKVEKGQFLSPGFIDTHNHAPQWAMRSLGQGLHILDWLEQVTFPHEARFSDPVYAAKVYESCVRGFLKQGITTASYYGSKHAEATQILADTCKRLRQRAFVGKCNMDRNAPSYLHDDSAESSLRETVECVKHIRRIDPTGKLVRPVLTPRFAICCTPDLLAGLGKMADEDPELAIQTHFNEAEQEINATRELFPEFSSEADLYHHFGLLTKRSILAHCTFMTDYEMDRIRENECGVAHCPISNMTVGGGFMAASIRQFLDRGIKVGLGTDSGGGFSSSMLDSIRQAVIASNAREVMSGGKDKALSLDEVFYLSTLGGASVCCLEDKIGNFAVGKEFDAIWVTCPLDETFGVMTVREEKDSLRTLFEKFLMTGDDRNIARVYVQGKLVKDALTA